MARLKRHQIGLLLMLIVTMVVTLAILAPLWFAPSRYETYFITVPETMTGPLVAIYPLEQGQRAQPFDEHTRVYDLPKGETILLVADQPPDQAKVALAHRGENNKINPLLFYSSGYGGNDLFFTDLYELVPFTLSIDGEQVSLTEIRFAVYDRRYPETLKAMNFVDGDGALLSQKARERAKNLLSGKEALQVQ